MNKQHLITGLLTLTLMHRAQTQEFNQQALLNRPCPDVYFSKVLNNGSQGIRISQFKGKPLVIYFYSVRCMACLRSFPTVDSLQKQFREKINILLVGKDKEAQVRQVLEDRQTLRNLALRIAVEDSVLRNVFKHTGVPHIIWVNSAGIVKAITGQINRESITAWIKTGLVTEVEKKDAIGKNSDDPNLYTDYNYTKSLDNILLYSYIAKAIDATSVATGPQYNEKGNLVRISDVGTIRKLYKQQYGIPALNPNSIVVEDTALSMDNTTYRCDFIQNRQWPAERFRKYVISYLDNFFGLHTSVEKRRVKCWVIKRTGAPLNLSTATGKYAEEALGGNRILTNHNWASIVYSMSNRDLRTPFQVIDETGIDRTKKLDMVLPLNMNELSLLRAALMKYGLDITEEEREVETIVLKAAK